MTIDRTPGITRSRFDAASDARTVISAERQRNDTPAFKLPAPPNASAGKSSTRSLAHERLAREQIESRSRDNDAGADGARSEHNSSSDGRLDRAQQRGVQSGTPSRSMNANPPESDAEESTEANPSAQASSDGAATRPSHSTGSARRAHSHTAAEGAASKHTEDSSAPIALKDINVREPAVPGDAPAVEPSLAERMLALLSGNLVVPVATPEPSVSTPAAGVSQAALPGGSQLPSVGATAVQLLTPGSAAPSLSPAGDGTVALPVGTTSASPATSSPAGVGALPVMAIAAASADVSATVAAVVESFGAALAVAGGGSKDPERAPSDASLSPVSIDASALMARAPTDLAATRVVQAAAIALPADLDAGFGDELGSRIVWMAEQKLGHAEIRVNPENLGPIDIRLQMDGNRISAQFQAANPDVRHALQAGMGHLRELLGRHGMELSDGQVGSQHQKNEPRASTGPSGPQSGGRDGESAGDTTTTLRSLRARGLIDEYV